MSDPAADFSSLVFSWLSDDLGSSLPELIGREIQSIPWDKLAVDGNFSGMGYTNRSTMRHICCYHKCENPGTIYIGENGNPHSQWICVHHLDKWHADHARFLAEGLGCEMEEL